MAFGLYVRLSAFGIAIVLFFGGVCAPSLAAEPKHVLLLHSFSPDVKPWSDYARAIRVELSRQSRWLLDIQEHSLVSARSADENPEIPFVQYLGALFSKRQPDLIISIGAPAAAFVQHHRQRLFPAVPMLLTVVDQRRVQYSVLTDNDAVVAVSIDYLSAFENILRVLPDTNSVVIVTGNSPIEKYWENEITNGVAPLAGRLKLSSSSDLSFEEFLKQAATLPPRTAIFWELMIVDAAGVKHEEGTALARLYDVASVPIFSYTDAFFGRDIVGGPHVPVLEAGQATAGVAMRILGGENPGDIKVPPVGMGTPKYDWRQLQRWGISESRLPPGSEIDFRPPSAWDLYRWQISLTALAFAIMTALLTGLLHERRHRVGAEVRASQRMSELAHLNRHATAGEMSAAIAHELNQPLGSIHNNAQTAELLIKSENIDRNELSEVLTDIRRDNLRASEIIRRLRALITKKAPTFSQIDFNDVAREAIAVAEIQAHERGVTIHTEFPSASLPVNGDSIQLQQTVINLVMNGIDAVSAEPNPRRNVVVRTSASQGYAEFSISDSGRGIPADQLKQIFDPFFTTKPAGMGMGLALARTIVEAHHGTIWAENSVLGGAVFRFRLPLIKFPA